MNGRELFRPKFEEVAHQCASCPFRTGNHEEFCEVVNRLRAKEDLPPVTPKSDVARFARTSLMAETLNKGDFMCHCTVYDGDMEQREIGEWRQCKGATEFYRHGKLSPKKGN